MIFEIEGVYMEEIKDKDYSLEAVPESARKGFRSMFLSCLDLPSFPQV